MTIHRRKDSGAWEVHVNRPGLPPIRRSSSRWTRADALAEEQRIMDSKHTLSEALDRREDEYMPFLKGPERLRKHADALRPLLTNRALADAPNVALECRKKWGVLKPAILRRLCNLAFTKWGWLEQPVAAKIGLLRENNERRFYLTHDEAEALSQACTHPHVRGLIIFAAYTGLRLGEPMQTIKRPVIVHGDSLLLNTTKNGRPRTIPLHPRALEIVRRMPFNYTPIQLRRQWYTARAACRLEHIHWHDLRHTFASWLVQSGAPLHTVKELLGHRTLTMTMRYAHLVTDNLRAAVQRLS